MKAGVQQEQGLETAAAWEGQELGISAAQRPQKLESAAVWVLEMAATQAWTRAQGLGTVAAQLKQDTAAAWGPVTFQSRSRRL